MQPLRIKEIRIKSGMSQLELANKLNVNQTAISQWERGASYPSYEKLPILARLLNCTIDELYGLTPSRQDANRPGA